MTEIEEELFDLINEGYTLNEIAYEKKNIHNRGKTLDIFGVNNLYAINIDYMNFMVM